MAFFDKTQPLGLPKGSVRSLLALGLISAFVLGNIPLEVAVLVLAFYFDARKNSE